MKTPFLFKNLRPLLAVLILSFCMLSCTRCSNPPKEPVSDSYKKKLISYKEGRILYDEYSRTNNVVLTRSRNGEPDSRWYWFSVEDMEGYIKYVKETAKKQNLKNPGIRIYMGKYPMNHPKNKMAKPEYAGYQTIFLVPTAQNKKKDSSRVMSRNMTSSDENTNVNEMKVLNMTNLAPPPKVSTADMP
ncbi:hypothetical protein CLU96_0612 [Chryseobacterium sp. 52]|uniref:hypothetical protein n=1 Tax=Chryseobacterium sp. 52 TaxID=2035213 RepID=UPI000C19157A|nr:hypothetical protein [Chryseobacterium sp. 52]PIF43700.1 hypothetical protein CLU96_0612 [Chryseobacterium sp. 52]